MELKAGDRFKKTNAQGEIVYGTVLFVYEKSGYYVIAWDHFIGTYTMPSSALAGAVRELHV